MQDFYSFAEPQHFDALVEVLPVRVHQVGGLVLLQTAQQTALVVGFILLPLF